MNIYIDPKKKSVIEACVAEANPVLMIGETGLGKTTIIREIANEKKKNLVRVSLNGSTSTEEIIGKWLAKDGTTFWQDGILISAMKNGDWIVFDEINAALPEVLFALHSLLDDDRKVTIIEKDNEVVHPHSEFMFFATMNPTEEYSGTKEMNKALVSRFHAVIHIEVPDPVTECKILQDKGIEPWVASKLVAMAEVLRKNKADEQIYYFCSTRDLIHAGMLVKGGIEFDDAVTYGIMGKMSKLEQDYIKKSGIHIAREFTKKISITDILAESIKNKQESDVFRQQVEETNTKYMAQENQVVLLKKEIADLTSGKKATGNKDRLKALMDKAVAGL